MIETILYNGNIITLDVHQARASAVAVMFDRIVAAGRDAEVLNLATAHTNKINLEGKTVLPGLTDAHLHFEWLARALQDVDLFEVPTKAEALSRIAARVLETEPGAWLSGRGWSQDYWDGGAFPTAADLDAVAPNHPAVFRAKSGHASWVNSAALKKAHITAETPDPDGGEIVRDANGEPTGILLESAMSLVDRLVPHPDADTLAGYMQHAQDLMLASGLTGFHDFDNPSCLQALQILRERGLLGLRVVKQINKNWLDAALDSGIRSGFGDHWIRFGGLKLFADGALGPRTAYMVEPYEGQPDNIGIPVVPKEEMLALVSRASAAGLSSTIHAIGDRAVREVLDIFAHVRAEEARRGIASNQLRHRIEHVQLIHPDDANRLAELDVIASMQPVHATSDWQPATQYWGEERCEYAYNARLQIDVGAKVAFGSDAPVEPFAPFVGIHAAVTRERNGQPPGGWYPELKLTLDEALHGFTTGAAFAGMMEKQAGRLKRGYLADLIVLNRDPYEVEDEALRELEVEATMVGGQWRYGGLD